MKNSNASAGGYSVGRTQKIVGVAIFSAIVIVLQLIGSFIKIGPFSISLVLLPIVIGAALYGTGAGTFLGAVFGAVVSIACINGTDQGGFILWSARPFFTVLLCMVKGIAAGFAAGIIYNSLKNRRPYLAVMASAVVCPVVNTGIFCLAMATVFYDNLVAWAGGTALVYYMFVVLVGFNFLFEMITNVILSPVVVRVVHATKRK